MKLSDAACRNAKPGDKLKKLGDGGGLSLCIMPTGSKLWWWSYRYGGKQKTLSLGPYPAVSLSDARSAAIEARKVLGAGIDRSSAKRSAKTARTNVATTFHAFSNEFLEKQRLSELSEATMTKLAWLLSFANDAFGDRQITEIQPADVMWVLKKVQDRGRYDTAHRLASTMSGVFQTAIWSGHLKADPTYGLHNNLARPPRKNRAAITDPKAFGALLRSIEGFNGHVTTTTALLLMALLFTRPGEMRKAEWTEFDFEKKIWTIPEARTKKRRTHEVPLSTQAITLLERVKVITGTGRFVFPSVRTAAKPMSENCMNAALRSLGYSKDQMCAHGFRGSASTLLNEAGVWHPDAIERQLAHLDKDAVRRAYNKAVHWDDRVKMMQAWADYLDRLKTVGQIIPLGHKLTVITG